MYTTPTQDEFMPSDIYPRSYSKKDLANKVVRNLQKADNMVRQAVQPGTIVWAPVIGAKVSPHIASGDCHFSIRYH